MSRRRPQFAAYNHHHNEPPADLPDFTTSIENMRRSYEAQQREERERQFRRQVEERVRLEQERSIYSVKQVNMDDDDDDDDDDDEDNIANMGIRSAFDTPPPPVIIYVEKSKKKKHKKDKKRKHRKHSSSSSSDDESGSHKKKKRRNSFEDNPLGEGTSQQKSSRIQDSPFHAKNNHWKILRKSEYVYQPNHMVIDNRGDPANLQYEQPYKYEVPEYRSVIKQNRIPMDIHAISMKWKELISEPIEVVAKNDLRLHSKKFFQNWNKLPVEKNFRSQPHNFDDYVSLSHQPFVEDDESASKIKHELDAGKLQNMDINDYAHYLESKKISYEEALECNIDGQYSVLHNKVNMNKNDVTAWLEYIDIQRPYFAKHESGDPKADIQNRKAFYERIMEIIRQAITANQSSAELYIKKLDVMEDYLGITSDEVRREWQHCENKFVNNIKMWEENLRMKQNDRTSFTWKNMIAVYDKAIRKLVAVKDATIRSHKMMEGTEEFLVDLIVGRCRLHIAAGYLDKAISMLQALAEFHFFHPEKFNINNIKEEIKPKTRREQMLHEFRTFWETGVSRIGDQSAEGWCNVVEYNQEEQIDFEIDELDGEKIKIREAENREVENYKKRGISLIEARRRLDKFRARHFWKPVRLQDPENERSEYYEHSSRKTTFDEIKSILFEFNNQELAQNLIFKLLHIFGVTVPGMRFITQEDILRTFSSRIFHSFRPNSLDLEGFEAFMRRFICLLSESEQMNTSQILPMLATCVSNSSIKKSEKLTKLFEIVRNDGGNIYNRDVSNEKHLAIYMVALEEIFKLCESGNNPTVKQEFNMEKDRKIFAFIILWRMLYTNLDVKDTSLWQIGEKSDSNETPAMSKQKRLFFLRYLTIIIRNLPFSDEPNADSHRIEIKYERQKQSQSHYLKTKKELLLSIWLNGRVAEVANTPENIAKAQIEVRKRLKVGAPKDIDDLKYRWIGNEHELIFELAALFCYEFPYKTHVQRYKFFLEDTPLFTSGLALSLSENMAVQETRMRVLRHIASNTLEFTPANLIKFIEGMVIRFPHSLELLKALLDVTNNFNQRLFLCRNPGKDKFTRFIRDCGRLYAEIRRFNFEMQKINENEYGDRETATMLTHLIDICKKIAEQYSDNMIPDDYIWCFLMKAMIEGRDELSYRTIDEIFTIGQKVCPWSKDFLFDAAQGRPSSESLFLVTLNGLVGTHQLQSYCTDAEVDLLMTHNIV